MDRIKLVLAADMHLATSFAYLDSKKAQIMQDAQEKSLGQLCKYCQQHEIKFLFIAGDLFDTIDIDKALLRRTQQSFALCKSTQVFIVPGNHDPYYEGGFWDDSGWPNNVTIVKELGTCIEIDSPKIRIYSEPFLSQSAKNSLVNQLEPQIDPSFFNILFIHGDLLPAGQVSYYNPIPIQWLEESGIDLAILGHKHTASELIKLRRTSYIYPGVLVGRAFDELGKKGFYSGSISKKRDAYGRDYHSEINFNFIPLKQVLFQELFIDVNYSSNADYLTWQEELLELCRNKINDLKRSSAARMICLRIILKGNSEHQPDLNYLHASLSEDIFHLEIIDQSRRNLELEKYLSDHSLKGNVARICLDFEKQLLASQVNNPTHSPEHVAERKSLPDRENFKILDGYSLNDQIDIFCDAEQILFDYLNQES